MSFAVGLIFGILIGAITIMSIILITNDLDRMEGVNEKDQNENI